MDVGKVRPLADNVLVQLDVHIDHETEQLTPGGIVIPKSASANVESQDAIIATVIAAGPGHYNDRFVDHEVGTEDWRHGAWIPLDPAIIPGCRVILEKRAMGADRIYGEGHAEYRMVRADCIAAVIEDA